MPPEPDLTGATRGMADLEPGLRLHYVTPGQGARTIVLLHGFPQTWWEWRHTIPALVADGFRVVAPDYRGAGHSWRPPGGYDKQTMANDIHQLLRRQLRIQGPVVLVGHDIGLMDAYAYAQAHPDEVSHLVVVDAPLPGTAVFDRLRNDPRCGISPSTMRATWRRCWSPTVSGSTCRPSSTGIEPFDRLVAQVMTTKPYASARQVFWIVDNGSSHRGQAAIRRLEAPTTICG